MGQIAKLFEELSCRMLVGLFLVLWGVTFFLSGAYGFLDVSAGGYSGSFFIIEVLWNFSDLAISVVLFILGLKVLGRSCLSYQKPSPK